MQATTAELEELYGYWALLFVGADPARAAAGFHQIVRRYEEPHRYYHTAQHLLECLRLLDKTAHFGSRNVIAAVFYHDAVYDTARGDNEEQSAWLARETSGEVLFDRAVVAAWVRNTKQHLVRPTTTPAEALFLDLDLAVLGAGPARFAEYDAQIRQEYAWVPEAVYRARRAEVLAAFLARPVIFMTPEIAAAREAQARRNLQGAVAKLTV